MEGGGGETEATNSGWGSALSAPALRGDDEDAFKLRWRTAFLASFLVVFFGEVEAPAEASASFPYETTSTLASKAARLNGTTCSPTGASSKTGGGAGFGAFFAASWASFASCSSRARSNCAYSTRSLVGLITATLEEFSSRKGVS